MAARFDRRRFLVAGAGLLAAGAAGCSGSGTIKVKPTTSTTAGGAGPFAVQANVFQWYSGIDQRVAFALAQNDGTPIHPSEPVTVQIGPRDGSLGPAIATVAHGQGLATPYLLASYRFPAPGNYRLRVTYQGRSSELPMQVEAASATALPIAGKAMISLPTPTFAAPHGVNPVCTATPKPCPLHQVSLDTALAQHRPVALLFAGPALCQSRLCGPVLDNLVAVHQPFADRVAFIHCEIYTDLTGANSTQPVIAYHLENEPMLLLAGADGVIRARLDNAFDTVEATDALNRLLSA